ncbi:MAG: type II toxin-antitoxin system RelE/ParE family toxin [Bifidobacteriaceae bacterium]|jgi:mRNA interferase RelE/StbE|nr:type II toxin-antitoxin system RelE/ParE family toxin [Bifidobacteriaceae bacterium]
MASQPVWKMEYLPRAVKTLRRMDRGDQALVVKRLERLACLDDPTSRCKALQGPLTGLWRLRVADFRVGLDIRRGELLIVAVDVGHRSAVYR